jgi:hypothetical protein
MSVRRGVRGLESIFRDQIKGSDERVVISKVVVVVVIIYGRFWGTYCECVMWFIMRREYL